MGIGTWQWGDRMMWGYGSGVYSDEDLWEVFKYAIDCGVNFFDTAELYGLGRSESILGRFIDKSGANVVVATKFMPYPFRLHNSSLVRALGKSLKRLKLDRIDLYQMHHPLPPVPIQTWMAAMVEAFKQDLIKAVGVSNYNPLHMSKAHAALKEYGINLASNQLKYSLLDRNIEKSGLLDLCRDLNVSVIAYSPLEKGILTGKYTPENPPPGPRSRIYDKEYLTRIKPLLRLMNVIGTAHGDKTPAQVAINWTICKGTVPIPGIKNMIQLKDNLGALNWQLTSSEIAELDKLSDRLSKQ